MDFPPFRFHVDKLVVSIYPLTQKNQPQPRLCAKHEQHQRRCRDKALYAERRVQLSQPRQI